MQSTKLSFWQNFSDEMNIGFEKMTVIEGPRCEIQMNLHAGLFNKDGCNEDIKTNEKQKSSFTLLLCYAFHHCFGSSGIAKCAY